MFKKLESLENSYLKNVKISPEISKQIFGTSTKVFQHWSLITVLFPEFFYGLPIKEKGCHSTHLQMKGHHIKH